MNNTDHPDDLVTLTTRPTEFEANVLVAVLREAGIEAFAFGALNSIMPIAGPFTAVPVQVRRIDVDRAETALKQNVADSVDLDWDEVDVGEREDNLPFTTRKGMPWLARGGWLMAALAIGCMILLAIWTIRFW